MSEDGVRAAHPSDDRWIDLSRGLLDPDSRRLALDHLRSCAGCETRFREICRDAELLDLGPVPDFVGSPVLAPRPQRRVRRGTVWAVSLATAALALLAIFRMVEHGTTRDLSYRLPVQSERLMLRSLPADEESASLLAAVEAYGHDDFDRVIELLEGRPLHDELEFLSLYYASALVWKKRPHDAEGVLARLHVDTLPLPYRDRARRILYVALRELDKGAEADRVLGQLAATDGELAEWAQRELTRVRARPSG